MPSEIQGSSQIFAKLSAKHDESSHSERVDQDLRKSVPARQSLDDGTLKYCEAI